MYHWGGGGTEPQPVAVTWPEKFNPEAVLPLPGGGGEQLLLLSDDGTVLVDGCPCKELPDELRRRFRALLLPRP